MKVKILEEKIPNKTTDLFYDEPYEATSKDGVIFYAQYMGELQFDFKGETYYANTVSKLFDDPDFNDSVIGDIEFVYNGWLEISAKDELGLERHDSGELLEFLDERDIAGDYDEGLDLLKRICLEWENEHELTTWGHKGFDNR